MKHFSFISFPSKSVTVFLLAALWGYGCTAVNPVVQSDYDRTAVFAHFRTYAWMQPDAAPVSTETTPAYSTLIDQRVKAAVESELLKKGLTPATTSTPDLLLAYDITVTVATELANDYTFAPGFGYGYSHWYGYRYNYNYERVAAFRNVRDYQVGTLIIDLIDPTNNVLVWRGWTESNMDAKVLDETKISRLVARVLAQYPPGTRVEQNTNIPGR